MGGKFFLQESPGTIFKGLFPKLCYYNQIDTVSRKRLKNFLACHKNQGRTLPNFRRSLLIYKDRAAIKSKKIMKCGKTTETCCPGVAIATQWVWACFILNVFFIVHTLGLSKMYHTL